MRTNLTFIDAADHPQSIVVTSSVASEGKSTVTMNLALTMAQAGVRVCLIEADLRRPKVLEYMGMDGSVGLTDALIGQAHIHDLLQQYGNTNLWVIGSGPIPPNPSELLGSAQMRNTLAELLTHFDQVIIDARMKVKDAEIAFSPGFRWGTSLLPGQPILMEHVLDQTAITYPWTTVTNMSGEMIKTVLEDVCDNLFNPDPYYQQGGDMVRVGGLQWTCDPTAKMGGRIQNMMLKGKLIDPAKTYKVAGWAPVSEEAKNSGEPIWDVVAKYLRDIKTVKPVSLNLPTLKGAANNPGIA